jgi:hypothetical protein
MGGQREREGEAERLGDLEETFFANVCLFLLKFDDEEFVKEAVRVTKITPK